MIRAYRPEDLPALLQIWLEGNLDAHPFVPAEYWSEQMPGVQEALPGAELLIEEEAGNIRGFLGLQKENIAGIFVARDARGQGIGRRLLEEAKRRHGRLTLQVYEKNTAACRFYTANGFYEQTKQVDPDTGEREYHLIWMRP